MQRTVDGNNITLSQHLFKTVHSSAADLFFDLRLEWLVVVVEELLAFECFQSSEHTLTNTANSNGTNDLVFQIEFILGNCSDVPLAALNLLVSRYKVSDKGEDSHDDMLGNRHNVGSSDFGDSDTTVCLVGGIKVNVVGTDTGGDGDLELLGLGQSLCGQVTWVETSKPLSV